MLLSLLMTILYSLPYILSFSSAAIEEMLSETIVKPLFLRDLTTQAVCSVADEILRILPSDTLGYNEGSPSEMTNMIFLCRPGENFLAICASTTPSAFCLCGDVK